MRRLDAVLLPTALAAAIVLAGACRGPEVPHAFTGTTRYLCCNLYYDKTKITDAAYQLGTRIAFGTRVTIDRVRKDQVEFTPVGHPTITLTYKFGDRTQPFDTFLGRLFVDEDPRTTLRKVAAKRIKQIDEGLVEPGMTRQQVLMSRGLPPAHRTLSLESASWTYWQTPHDTFVVYFDGDKVARIGHW